MSTYVCVHTSTTYLQLAEVLLEAPQFQALLQAIPMRAPEFVESAFGLLQLHEESTIIATIIKILWFFEFILLMIDYLMRWTIASVPCTGSACEFTAKQGVALQISTFKPNLCLLKENHNTFFFFYFLFLVFKCNGTQFGVIVIALSFS